MSRPLIALGLVALSGCAPAASSSAPPAAAPAPPLRDRLHLGPAPVATHRAVAHLPARVIAPPWARHDLPPPYPGQLLSLAVKIGDEIAVGDPLGALRSPDLSALTVEERRWRTVARERARHVARLKRQVDQGFQSAMPMYEAQLAAEEAEAAAEGAAATRRAHLSGVSAVSPEGRWTWSSGVAGVIISVGCSPGAYLTPDRPCVEIVSPADLEVEIQVPEGRLGDLGDDPQLALHPTAGGPPRTLRLRRRAPAVNPRTGTLALYFEADGLPLGATGRGALLAEVSGARQIPRGAITELNDQQVIFVANADPEALPTPWPVQVIGHRGEDALIAAGDLPPEAQVVHRGAFLLKSLQLVDSE